MTLVYEAWHGISQTPTFEACSDIVCMHGCNVCPEMSSRQTRFLFQRIRLHGQILHLYGWLHMVAYRCTRTHVHAEGRIQTAWELFSLRFICFDGFSKGSQGYLDLDVGQPVALCGWLWPHFASSGAGILAFGKKSA